MKATTARWEILESFKTWGGMSDEFKQDMLEILRRFERSVRGDYSQGDSVPIIRKDCKPTIKEKMIFINCYENFFRQLEEDGVGSWWPRGPKNESTFVVNTLAKRARIILGYKANYTSKDLVHSLYNTWLKNREI